MKATSISVNVIGRRDGTDCTNGGVTQHDSRFLLWANSEEYDRARVDGHVTARSLICIHRSTGVFVGRPYVHCVPVSGLTNHGMFGGNFVHTSDSRYEEVTGVPYPIAVHDRYER